MHLTAEECISEMEDKSEEVIQAVVERQRGGK